MDKQIVKQTMLDLEEERFNVSQQSYLQYFDAARTDRTEPIEIDELAQAAFARDLSEAFDAPIHAHAHKIAKLKEIDFGPKSTVEEGAIVKLDGRYFVIAVSTDKFDCDGNDFMGISANAPIYQAIEGKRAGETATFNNRILRVDEVA